MAEPIVDLFKSVNVEGQYLKGVLIPAETVPFGLRKTLKGPSVGQLGEDIDQGELFLMFCAMDEIGDIRIRDHPSAAWEGSGPRPDYSVAFDVQVHRRLVARLNHGVSLDDVLFQLIVGNV